MSKLSQNQNRRYIPDDTDGSENQHSGDISKARINQRQRSSPSGYMEYPNEAYECETEDEDGSVRHNPTVPPGIQQMERGENPDDHDDEIPNEEPKKSSSRWVIVKRLVSAFFIIFDGFGDWWKFIDINKSLNNSTNSTDDGSIFIAAYERLSEIKDAVEGFKGSSKVECDTTTLTLTCVYIIFLALGTVYGLLQLINIFIETWNELVKKQNNFKKHSALKIFHGWIETFGSLLFIDIPQVILLVLFAASCRKEHVTSPWSLSLALVPLIKNVFRKSSCRQDQDGVSLITKLKQFKAKCITKLKRLIAKCLGLKIRWFSCNVPFFLCCQKSSCFKWVMCCHPPKREKLRNGDYDDGLDETYDPDKCVCCKCIPLVWECIGTVPFIGYLTVCRHRGCCDKKFKDKACCSWVWDICCKDCFKDCCKDCFKDCCKGCLCNDCCKDCCKCKCSLPCCKPRKRPTNDPTCIEPFIYILYVIDVMFTGLYFALRWAPDMFNTNDLFDLLRKTRG